ncbi:MAG: ABC transporter ATP-binding protein [Acidobacteriota bacterium]
MTAPSSPAPARAAPPDVARVTALGHRFGEVEALRGINWSLPPGRLVALVGANGAGKSTLLAILSGRLRPTAGTVLLFGARPRPDGLELRRRISFSGQRPALDPEMTGRELMQLFALLDGGPLETPGSRTVLDGLGLAEHLGRPVKAYSGGLRQRLHLAIDAARHAELQLWDEPTSALDVRGRSFLWRHLVAEARSGKAVVVASHDLAAVEEHADEVLLLHRGRTLTVGPPAPLVAEHGLETLTFEVSAEAPAPAPPLAGLPGVVTFEWSSGKLQIACRDGATAEGQVQHWLKSQGLAVREVKHRQPDLASVYFHLSSQPLAEPHRPGGRDEA